MWSCCVSLSWLNKYPFSTLQEGHPRTSQGLNQKEVSRVPLKIMLPARHQLGSNRSHQAGNKLNYIQLILKKLTRLMSLKLSRALTRCLSSCLTSVSVVDLAMQPYTTRPLGCSAGLYLKLKIQTRFWHVFDTLLLLRCFTPLKTHNRITLLVSLHLEH